MTVAEGQLLWTPSPEFIRSTNLHRFLGWLETERGLCFADYNELWRWSVADVEGFWSAIWEFFKIRAYAPYARILASRKMPGACWLEGARLNFSEHLLRREEVTPDAVAVKHFSELRSPAALTWHELGRQVRTLGVRLK